MTRIYVDHNASTPLSPAVIEAMRPYFEGEFGNPSSGHWAALDAKSALERARQQVANILHCQTDEVVFTSGGTEANNMALKGMWFNRRRKGNHIITSPVEHDAIRPETVLITIMHANNETGTIQPIAEIAAVAKQHGVIMHTDAAQSVGKITTDVAELGVDMLSLAGHKFYGPKGVGALYIREGVSLEPHNHGAGHESGSRAGTERALLTSGLGAACALAMHEQSNQVCALRDYFCQMLHDALGDKVVRNGQAHHVVPNTLNISIVNQVGAEILEQLEGVAAATGSACHAGCLDMSPVLIAKRTPMHVGMGAVRFSLGKQNTRAEIIDVVERISQLVN